MSQFAMGPNGPFPPYRVQHQVIYKMTSCLDEFALIAGSIAGWLSCSRKSGSTGHGERSLCAIRPGWRVLRTTRWTRDGRYADMCANSSRRRLLTCGAPSTLYTSSWDP